MSLCKHKRLPARRVYSSKHTAKCFKARLFRYHYRRGWRVKSAEVVRKMSLCKHKRLPARRDYSMKHTAKCFMARLFRYHYRRGRQNNGMALWPWPQNAAIQANEGPDMILGPGP